VRDEETKKVYVYVKGTGEALKEICNKNTLPADFDQVCTESAKCGIYQISIAVQEVVDQDTIMD
jgi:hypothetical protein